MLNRKKKNGRRSHTGQDYWQSYSDMMAALLLMFILIMSATLYQSLNTYEQKNAELERQRTQILAQQDEIDRQKNALADTEEQLDRLSSMVGVKAEIIQALSKEFANSNLKVEIDDKTGDIILAAGVLFDVDRANVSKEGQKFLKKFIPMYISVLLGDQFKSYISEIIIEGHTDTDGGYMYNLNLSQERAYAVSEYCLDEKKSPLSSTQIEALRLIVTANGRSYSDPIKVKGRVDKDASRRVVFKFRLRDDEMIEEMRSILVNVND